MDEGLIANWLLHAPGVFFSAHLKKSRHFTDVVGQTEILGNFSRHDLIENPFCYIHPDDHLFVHGFFVDLDNTPYELSYRITVNGQTRWVTEKGAYADSEGKVDRQLVGYIFDNTDAVEAQRQFESLLTHRTQELQVANEKLARSISEQAQKEQERISLLERSQLQQSITFEISTCDSVNRGDMQQATYIVSSKLKSGLDTSYVGYFESKGNNNFVISTDSEQHDKTPVTYAFPEEFIQRLSHSLCIDITDIETDRLESDLKELFSNHFKAVSALIFPIKYDQNMVGFLTIFSERARAWSIDEIIFVSSMGDQLRATLINRDKHLAAEKLHQLAYYDTLTGLENRAAFFENAKRAIDLLARQPLVHALVYIDLDDFKIINDTFGHDAGDHILVRVADVIKHTVRKTDHAARVGGDEFNLLLLDINDKQDVIDIINKLLSQLNEPTVFNDNELTINASVGICLVPSDAKELAAAIKLADQAMYKAKQLGKNQYAFAG